jgi:hypothetical protein
LWHSGIRCPRRYVRVLDRGAAISKIQK